MASETHEYSVADVPTRQRFEIRTGDQLAGFTEYRRSGRLIAFLHTEVASEFEGHGVASRLISTALDTAHSQQLSVLPFCPFVRGYIAKHPDAYLELVPADLREDFALPATASAPQA
jgi:predicted GNAT family acetyltransferase